MRRGEFFAPLGIAIATLACCAGLPLVVAFVGGLTATALLGGGLVLTLAVAAAAAFAQRMRRRPGSRGVPDRQARS
jgi:hypothetical protein